MNEQCHEVEDFGELVGLPADDCRLAHVRACPHCRGLMAAYESFAAGIPEKGDVVRENQLAAWLDDEINGSESNSEADSVAAIGHRRRFMSPPMMATGLATAAVLVLFLSFHEYRSTIFQDTENATRGDELAVSATDLKLSVSLVPDSGVRLSWNALLGADEYRVVVYTASLLEVARFEVMTDTSLVLSAEQTAGFSSESDPLIWRVEITKRGEVVSKSTPSLFAVTK